MNIMTFLRALKKNRNYFLNFDLQESGGYGMFRA